MSITDAELQTLENLGHGDAAEEIRELRGDLAALRNDLADALDCKNGAGPTALSLVIDERDSLRAELAASREREARMQWQPIETAPTDGARILLCGKGGKIADGYYGQPDGFANPKRFVWPYIHANPTHWAPLALIAAAQELLDAAMEVNALSIQTDAHKKLRAAIAKATGRVVADDAAPECTCAAKDMTFGRCCKLTPNKCKWCGHDIHAHDKQYGCAEDGCDCETPNAVLSRAAGNPDLPTP